MNDAFFQNYARYVILLCALVGFYCLPKLKSFNAGCFPYFLLLLFLGETVGYYLGKNGANSASSNLYIYFLLPVQILFYIWFIAIKALRKPKIAIGLIGLFTLQFLLEIFIGEGGSGDVRTKSYSFGGILLSILILLFILKLTRGDMVITFYQNPYFWICIGVAVYYTVAFPFFTYYNTLLNGYKRVFYVYRSITYHLSFSMYLLFIIRFICSKKS